MKKIQFKTSWELRPNLVMGYDLDGIMLYNARYASVRLFDVTNWKLSTLEELIPIYVEKLEKSLTKDIAYANMEK